MTLADSPPTGAGTAAQPEGAPAPAEEPAAPKLANGIELIGEYEGSGYKEAPSLLRRPDGQILQLPPLLYSLASKADGHRNVDQIATEVGEEIHRGLDGDQVRFLVEEKLRPLGVLAAEDGSSPKWEKPDPFLALRFRAAVISEHMSNVLGAIFKPLFFAPVLLAVLAVFVAADIWLFFAHGVAQSLRQSIEHPGLFLPLFAAVVISAAFHEIGHAAACRYGGGHPGKMGCGLYLAFPAFYTDVTDAYRLGKRSRLRTDLGGVYFNVVVVLVTMGAYFATHFEPLLLLVIIQHFEIAHQLLPVIRLDGYYIVADLTGVPDLFARIGPILRSLAPWHKADERVTLLKRWVRVAVTAWVLIVVPLLLFEMLIVLIHLPRILGTGWDSGTKLWHEAGRAFSHGNVIGGITDGLQVVVLIIPIAGILLMLVSAARRSGTWLWKHTEGRPIPRALGLACAAATVALLAFAWLPSHNYKPIQPGERGTVAEGVVAVRQLPGGAGPLYSEKAAIKRADASQSQGASSPSGKSGTSSRTPASSRPAPASNNSGAGAVSPTTNVVPQVTLPPVTATLPPATTPSTAPPTTISTPPTTAGSTSPTS